MGELPLVSVLMTAFNREKYIAEAIESVLSSAYTNFELIIVDDVSTDNTVNIARSFLNDNRVTVYINKKNLGDYPNRNRAAELAKGKYLMYVDSDDKIFPDSVEYCVNNMEDHPEAKLGMFCAENIYQSCVLTPLESIQQHFLVRPFLMVGPGGTFLNREFFKEIGMYPTSYGPANDMYFNLLAATKENILLLYKGFLFYRRHEGQEINNPYSYIINYYRSLRDALAQIEMPLSLKQKKLILKKNKRRFIVNIFKYFFKTFDIAKTKNAIRETNFTLKDAFEGIFHV